MEVVTVLEGRGEGWIEGQDEVVKLEPGVTLVFPANMRHWFQNSRRRAAEDARRARVGASHHQRRRVETDGSAAMLHTRLCDLLGIRHPVVLGGMGSSTSAALVAAVSNGGGFGTLGTSGASGAQITETVAAIRAATDKPFGINHLLFRIDEDAYAATLKARPFLAAFAWARKDQDLRGYFRRAHDAGLKVMHMAGEVPEAVRAVEAGADFIVAQGMEGGGHVGWMAALALVPMVVSAVAPVPVLAAGGIADGRGLAAALALGADGALLGTRFLATVRSADPSRSQAGDREERRARHGAHRNPGYRRGPRLAGRDGPRAAQCNSSSAGWGGNGRCARTSVRPGKPPRPRAARETPPTRRCCSVRTPA